MLPVRRVASESQLLRGRLYRAFRTVEADSCHRASTFPAAAPDRARIRTVRTRTGRRDQTPDPLDTTKARSRPCSGNHAFPQATKLDHQHWFLRSLHKCKSHGIHTAATHVLYQRKARRFHHALPRQRPLRTTSDPPPRFLLRRSPATR